MMTTLYDIRHEKPTPELRRQITRALGFMFPMSPMKNAASRKFNRDLGTSWTAFLREMSTQDDYGAKALLTLFGGLTITTVSGMRKALAVRGFPEERKKWYDDQITRLLEIRELPGWTPVGEHDENDWRELAPGAFQRLTHDEDAEMSKL